MLKYKYIYKNFSSYNKHLTFGKVYDVIGHIKNNYIFDTYDKITIKTDSGEILDFYIYRTLKEPYFENVSYLYRNEVIDEILK